MDLHHFAKCGFLLTFLCLTLPRQQAPLPQRRNGIAGHGPAGGAVADVADYGERACRPPPGRGKRTGWTGGDRVAPPTGTQIAPRWGRQGAGWPPSWGGRRTPPWPTLAATGGDGPWGRAHGMGLARTTFGSNPPRVRSQHRPESRSVARDT